MKKILALIMVAMMALCAVSALAEGIYQLLLRNSS